MRGSDCGPTGNRPQRLQTLRLRSGQACGSPGKPPRFRIKPGTHRGPAVILSSSPLSMSSRYISPDSSSPKVLSRTSTWATSATLQTSLLTGGQAPDSATAIVAEQIDAGHGRELPAAIDIAACHRAAQSVVVLGHRQGQSVLHAVPVPGEAVLPLHDGPTIVSVLQERLPAGR